MARSLLLISLIVVVHLPTFCRPAPTPHDSSVGQGTGLECPNDADHHQLNGSHGVDCYWLQGLSQNEKVTFARAREICKEVGVKGHGALATLQKPRVYEGVKEWLRQLGRNENVWVGLTDIARDDVMTWTAPPGVQDFRIHQRALKKKLLEGGHVTESSFDCGAIDMATGLFKEQDCNTAHAYLCHYKLKVDPAEEKTMKQKKLEEEQKIKEEVENDQILQNTALGLDDELFQADIIPTPEPSKKLRRRKRNAIDATYWPLSLSKWEDGVIPYEFVTGANAISPEDHVKIVDILKLIESKTCLTFEPKSPWDMNALMFQADGRGCRSYIGRMWHLSGQMVNLDSRCLRQMGTVVHEIMHALGFYHEQTRRDRDKYVYILWDNIKPGFDSQFSMTPEEKIDNLNFCYDYGSVLHYSAFTFSKDYYTLRTIVPTRPETAIIGQRAAPSANDINKINVLYGCTDRPINGGWDAWTSWSAVCSKSCGGGKISRTRTCTCPAPRNNGAPCEGEHIEYADCNTQECPQEIKYQWIGCWYDRADEDELLTPIEGDTGLEDSYQERADQIQKCAEAAAKKGEISIFALKDGGKCYVQPASMPEAEYRSAGPSADCGITGTGGLNAIDVYKLGEGAVDGQWGVQELVNLCSVACGTGTKTYRRECDNPKPSDGGVGCEGEELLEETCNTQPCPVDGQWGAWKPWSACTATCGDGQTRSRDRDCDSPAPKFGGQDCLGDSSETEICDLPLCSQPPSFPDFSCKQYGVIDDTVSYYQCFEHVGQHELAGYPSDNPVLKEKKKPQTTTGRKGSAVLLSGGAYLRTDRADEDWLTCLSDPETCTDGFTVSLWFQQTPEQRIETLNKRPQMLLNTGPEAGQAESNLNGLGVALYITPLGMVQALVRLRQKVYTSDLPAYLFENTNKWHHVALTWSPMTGLVLYYKGEPRSWHFDGDENSNSRHVKVYNQLYIGRPAQFYEHPFQGAVDELVVYDGVEDSTFISQLFKSVPWLCQDCDQNADCDDVGKRCVCKSGYAGDGYRCEQEPDTSDVSVHVDTPAYCWPMDKIQGNAVEGSAPLIVENKKMFVSLGIENKAVVFNGRRDWLSAGDFADRCLDNPSNCPNGFTIAFWVRYHGRGASSRPNFILSSGAEKGADGTGLALWVVHSTAYARVQSATRRYECSFHVTRGQWAHYTIRWTENEGLEIFKSAQKLAGDAGREQTLTGKSSSILAIGKPNYLNAFNGRFNMDNLVIWETALTNQQVTAVANGGVEIFN